MHSKGDSPLLLITMGDVAGIGPEIIARAWPDLVRVSRPVIVGDPGWLGWAVKLVKLQARVHSVLCPDEIQPRFDIIPCLVASNQTLGDVELGKVSAKAGRAAYDFLCKAIDESISGNADGIVTAPIHKEGLCAAGLAYPGHTEILAERTGTQDFAMALYTEGLTVVHVTLHMALRDVFEHISQVEILKKIRLLNQWLSCLLEQEPRIGVAALNPHASDGGLFGTEEAQIIRPAVDAARAEGVHVTGPWPCDSLFVRARQGEFDGVVVMYHDQGHIALKLLNQAQAVNVCMGLPIIRTSVAHGTAYDIVGRGTARPESLIQAVRLAARLAILRGKACLPG